MKSLFSILNKKLDMNVSMKFYQNSYVFGALAIQSQSPGGDL